MNSGDGITIMPSVSGGESADDAAEFYSAIRRGDADTVTTMLFRRPQLANEVHDRATPLHFAALENQQLITDLLLAHGADLEVRDEEFNMTPIGWANERGHRKLVEHLYERGAQVNLFSAVAFGLEECVRELLNINRDHVNDVDHYGTPIHGASLWGHVEIVKMLLANGADPELKNVHGDTALDIAKKQVETNCRATPIVVPSRRTEIAAGCAAVVALLEKRGNLRLGPNRNNGKGEAQ